MSDANEVLILTKYGRSGPSSRYRILQYIPYLESRGLRCTVQSLHADDYLEDVYAGRRKSNAYYAGRLLARAAAVARATHYSVVFVQKELAPYCPPFLEALLSMMRSKVVYDIDDAIFLPYLSSKSRLLGSALRNKIPSALRRSTVVVAGNSFLKDYAARFNPRTVLVPTVVDPAKYAEPARARSARETPVIGWIGSPDTVRFLEERAEALRSVARGCRFELRVIGVSSFAIPGIGVTCVPWSEETEARELARFDVGIMPLPSNDWARGKCGLKLLQYMAAGLPVVSSPEGAADRIVSHGMSGYIARGDEEWRLHLSALLDNPDLRGLMGREGRRRVEEHFSLGLWAPRMAEILEKCIRGEHVGDESW